MTPSPPHWAERGLGRLLENDEAPSLLGDYAELFAERVQALGGWNARRWYWGQLLRVLASKGLDALKWSLIMIHNYLKIAFRQLWRQKGYTLINLSGLAVGLALFILATLYADFFLSYNTFHRHKDHLLLLGQEEANGNMRMMVPDALAPHVLDTVQGVKGITRYDYTETFKVRSGDKNFKEYGFRRVDPAFFHILDFPLVQGDVDQALTRPDQVVVTENMALKYFGAVDVVGQTLELNGKQTVTICGVAKDVPKNSSIRFDFLLPIRPEQDTRWDYRTTTIVLLDPQARPDAVFAQIESLLKANTTGERAPKRLITYPLKDLLFRPNWMAAPFNAQPRSQFYMIMALAIVLLGVVCINFMNLATSQALSRAKEVGLRKVIGAARRQLIHQFLGEALLIALLALPLALGLYTLIRPFFVTFMDLKTSLALLDQPRLIPLVLGVTLMAGLVSGAYPALVLSSYRPAAALRRQNSGKGGKGLLRQVLVVMQYVFSLTLIITTLVTLRQFDFLMKTDLGYNRHNVLILPFDEDASTAMDPIRKELLESSDVAVVGKAVRLPVDWGSLGSGIQVRRHAQDESSSIHANLYGVGQDFIQAIGMRIQEGRAFSPEFNEAHSAIVSRSLVERMGWDAPLGQSLVVDGWEARVIGVVDDFHFKHVFYAASHGILRFNDQSIHYLLVRHAVGQHAKIKGLAQAVWDKHVQDQPFECIDFNEGFIQSFRQTVKGKELIALLSGTAIFFSCLGLFGLAAFTIAKKTKEIAVRKVLGASVRELTARLIGHFLLIIAIANAVAVPAGYWGGSFLLNMGWVKRITIGPDLYAIAIGLSLATALLAVTAQTLRAASRNPATALRTE